MRRGWIWIALALVVGCGDPERPSPEADTPPPEPIGFVASTDGVPVRYELRGDGPIALVFVHGWCCDRDHWSNQTEFFSRDHTVVTLDLPGHGESGSQRPGWPLAAYGEDVKVVIEELELERVVLVGHSMGGVVALDTARLLPDRVLGIVGVDTLQDAESRLDPQRAEEILAAFKSDFVGTCDGFVRGVLFLDDSDPGLVDRVAGGMCDAPPEIALALWRQFLDRDIPAAMRAVDVPLRCINGSLRPTRVEINRKYARDFDVLLMDGVGHFPMLERPEEFNRLLAEVVEELTGA